MPLQKQDISILLGKGVDTHIDAKVVQPGQLLVSENCNLNKKEGSAYLRNGYDALPTAKIDRGFLGSPYSPAFTNIQKVATLNDELVAITDNSVWGYSEDQQAWAWKGYCGNVTSKVEPAIRNGSNFIISDSIVFGGLKVVAGIGRNFDLNDFVNNSQQDVLYVTVIDEESGKVVAEQSTAASSSLPTAYEHSVKIIAHAGKIFVYHISWTSSSGTIKVTEIDPADPQAIATNNYNGGISYQSFDVITVGSEAIMATATYGTGFDVELTYLKSDGTPGGVVDGLPANAVTVTSGFGTGTARAVNLSAINDGTNDAIYLFFGENIAGSNVQIYGYDLTFSNTFNTTQFFSLGPQETYINCTSVVVEDTCYYFYSIRDTFYTLDNYFTRCEQVTISGVRTARSHPLTGTVYSRPKIIDDNLYIVFANTGYGTEQKSYFLMRENFMKISNSTIDYVLNPVCQMLANEGISDEFYIGYSANITEQADGSFYIALVRSFAITDASSTVVRTAQNIEGCKLVFNSPNAYQVVETENSLYISGGFLWVYDGNIVFENGFLTYPVLDDASPDGAGNVNVGAHTYQCTYEWSDRTGNRHISAPSLNLAETVVTSAKLIDVDVKYTSYTYKYNNNFFSTNSYGTNLYRTPVGSTIRYRVTLTSPEPSNGSIITTNIVDAFADNLSDADLIENEILYTNGGVLEDLPIGSMSSIEQYQGRIIGSDLEEGNVIAFSKQKKKNVTYQFNSDLKFRVLEESSRVKATKVLDDKLILFKESSLYVQVGQGPSDTGENSDYLQNPQRISSNVGCPYPKSIVRFDGGLIFKSKDGFYLLDRSLNLQAIGKPVDQYKNLTTTDAVLLEDRDEIRWVHSDGVCLVYNYYQNQWATYTNHEAVSCTVWDDKFVIAKTNGAVWVENKSSYLDDGVAYQRRIVTPWIALGGLQHAERIYRIKLLGEMRSRHDLTMYLAYDYEPARREQLTWNSFEELGDVSLSDDAYYDTPPTYTNQNRTYDIEIRPSIQKCEAFRLEIIDTADTDGGSPVDGGRAVWTSLTATVGVKRSTLRSSPTRRADPQ